MAKPEYRLWEFNDFVNEILCLWSQRSFNFGKDAVALDVVREAVVKAACGFHNGSTAESIIVELGFITKKRRKLTRKGQYFVWVCVWGKYETKV